MAKGRVSFGGRNFGFGQRQEKTGEKKLFVNKNDGRKELKRSTVKGL